MGRGHLVYASTRARDPPSCVWGGWCTCVYVCVGACTETCKHVCVCVCARQCERACARVQATMSAGCLCFSVRQFHFVLYD